MANNCSQKHDSIVDYILDVLNHQQANNLMKHIDKCSACKEYMEALKKETSLLTQFGESLEVEMENRKDRVIKELYCLKIKVKGSSVDN